MTITQNPPSRYRHNPYQQLQIFSHEVQRDREIPVEELVTKIRQDLRTLLSSSEFHATRLDANHPDRTFYVHSEALESVKSIWENTSFHEKIQQLDALELKISTLETSFENEKEISAKLYREIFLESEKKLQELRTERKLHRQKLEEKLQSITRSLDSFNKASQEKKTSIKLQLQSIQEHQEITQISLQRKSLNIQSMVEKLQTTFKHIEAWSKKLEKSALELENFSPEDTTVSSAPHSEKTSTAIKAKEIDFFLNCRVLHLNIVDSLKNPVSDFQFEEYNEHGLKTQKTHQQIKQEIFFKFRNKDVLNAFKGYLEQLDSKKHTLFLVNKIHDKRVPIQTKLFNIIEK